MTGLRRRHRRCWLVLCLLACTWPAHALQLRLQGPSLSARQAAASRQLLDAAIARVPPGWHAALARPIPVEWRDNLPAQVHGRALSGRMLLDRELLRDWMARPASAGPEHPARRAALAAVIHELAHFYDRSDSGGLSLDPRFLDLAGWQVSPLWFGLRIGDNAFSDRSPDRYELHDPVEYFAVNMEHFLLDPAYACRRPALYRYFAEQFEHSPPHRPCAPGLVFLQPGAGSDQPPLLQLDSARVYAVDYLLAEGNDRFMSRWGHSMLRLVICAPGRPRGPDCRLDLRYHRVLSFRAFVDDVQISSWRGLTGSYPSRLFVLPLVQVIEEYTKVQLRGLQSIPLKLQRAEITGLLQRAAKLHWSYDGRYYFLSNNCAVETFKLLHDGVPRLAAADLGSITPTDLLQRLREAGIADTGVLDDRAEARRLGYYFEAADTHYQAMFEVADRALQLPPDDVHDWLELSPAERTLWLRSADLRASAALLLLENAALRREQQRARGELKRRIANANADKAGTSQTLAALREVLRLEGVFSHPAELLPDSGYGLPQQRERAALLEAGTPRIEQWRQSSERLRHVARQWLSPQRQAALQAGEANVALLGHRLRKLHQEQGELDLQPGSPELPGAP